MTGLEQSGLEPAEILRVGQRWPPSLGYQIRQCTSPREDSARSVEESPSPGFRLLATGSPTAVRMGGTLLVVSRPESAQGLLVLAIAQGRQ